MSAGESKHHHGQTAAVAGAGAALASLLPAPPAGAASRPPTTGAAGAAPVPATNIRCTPPNAFQLLLHRIRAARCVPFVGAGVSMHTFPSWLGILEAVWDRTGRRGVKTKTGAGEPYEDMLYRTKTGVKTAGGWPFVTDILQLTAVISAACASADTTFEAVVAQIFADKAQSYPRAVLARCTAHYALLEGGFPLILTTNWDDLFERVADDQRQQRRGNRLHVDSRGQNLRVRYRAQIGQLFGELKGHNQYDGAPLLLKFHGDFTPAGRKEFVAGHASYRQMRKGESATNAFLRYVASEYSLFFYGTSLSDADLLGVLDETMESFGSSTGPHFWLTADDVSAERMEFLNRQYAVQTIRVSGPRKWQVLERELSKACRACRTLPGGLGLRSMKFDVTYGATLEICSRQIPRGPLEDGEDGSVAMSCPLVPLTGSFNAVRGRAGRQLANFCAYDESCQKAFLQQSRGFSDVAAIASGDSSSLAPAATWRALQLDHFRPRDGSSPSMWIVMADSSSSDAADARQAKHFQNVQVRIQNLLSSVAEAVEHFVRAAVEHECDVHLRREEAARNSLLGRLKKQAGAGADQATLPGVARLRVVMPLLCTGVRQLGERNALRTMLSTISAILEDVKVSTLRRFRAAGSAKQPVLELQIALPPSGPDSTILRDIACGAFPVAHILALGKELARSFRTVVLDAHGGVVRSQQVLSNRSDTFATLRATVGLSPSAPTRISGSRTTYPPDTPIYNCPHIVEGCTLEIMQAAQAQATATMRQLSMIEPACLDAPLQIVSSGCFLEVWRKDEGGRLRLGVGKYDPASQSWRDRKGRKDRSRKETRVSCIFRIRRAADSPGEYTFEVVESGGGVAGGEASKAGEGSSTPADKRTLCLVTWSQTSAETGTPASSIVTAARVGPDAVVAARFIISSDPQTGLFKIKEARPTGQYVALVSGKQGVMLVPDALTSHAMWQFKVLSASDLATVPP